MEEPEREWPKKGDKTQAGHYGSRLDEGPEQERRNTLPAKWMTIYVKRDSFSDIAGISMAGKRCVLLLHLLS